jgi:hypothetical protein
MNPFESLVQQMSEMLFIDSSDINSIQEWRKDGMIFYKLSDIACFLGNLPLLMYLKENNYEFDSYSWFCIIYGIHHGNLGSSRLDCMRYMLAQRIEFVEYYFIIDAPKNFVKFLSIIDIVAYFGITQLVGPFANLFEITGNTFFCVIKGSKKECFLAMVKRERENHRLLQPFEFAYRTSVCPEGEHIYFKSFCEIAAFLGKLDILYVLQSIGDNALYYAIQSHMHKYMDNMETIRYLIGIKTPYNKEKVINIIIEYDNVDLLQDLIILDGLKKRDDLTNIDIHEGEATIGIIYYAFCMAIKMESQECLNFLQKLGCDRSIIRE